MQDCQEIKDVVQDIYDKVVFHGIYVKYGYCVKRLISLLRIEDPAELHYVMMHLGRLSCINNRYGRYVWTSERYRELHGFQEAFALESQAELTLFNEEVELELEKMRLSAFNLSQVSSSFVNAILHSKTEFASHVKVYPIYNPQGNVVATLTILTEIMSRQSLTQAVQSHPALSSSS
ncbi:MAG: hypothetical protein NTV32_03395, partial [Gammaproteobacteria bacterium]|nr:hypothetical protein [Gammaproteobacteria bacterium]